MVGETMSDWEIAIRNAGRVNSANAIHTDKIEDAERLRKSGLPQYRGLQLPYNKFMRDNRGLSDFLEFCKGGVVIRALPQTKDLPRRYKIGVNGFEECLAFLKENVVQGESYIVYLTEWEPQSKSGIVISNAGGLRAEIGNCGLDELSHGRDPTLSCTINLTKIGHLEDKIVWQRRGEPEDRIFLERILKTLELTRDRFNPHYRRGYFELVLTENGKIRFVDYKVNSNYLK